MFAVGDGWIVSPLIPRINVWRCDISRQDITRLHVITSSGLVIINSNLTSFPSPFIQEISLPLVTSQYCLYCDVD